MKAVSVVVTVTTLTMVVDPPRAQAQSRVRIPVVPQASGPSPAARLPADRYAESLDRLKSLAAEEREHSARRPRTPAPEQTARLEAIRKTVSELEASEAASDESFAAVGREIEARKLGNVIRDRHRAAEREYKKRRTAMKQILEGLKTADARGDSRVREARVLELDAFLAKNSPGRSHKKLDPNHLPWRNAERTLRKPATTTRTFRAFAAPTTATRALATVGTTATATLPPTAPEYLAETDDAQLTPAVRELATSLGGNPVRIYEWVRNNVEYFPSFGSIQGSDVTLSKRRGNAFDTASLLVAMLRASGIPARYVYGTIEAPAAAVQDWVGGVTTPSAAQQILGQGGVPNAAMITGNQITHIQVEHVWVEAWTDFAPSRGSLSRQGDTWVPLDASFKQHDETVGLRAQAAVPIDGAQLYANLLTGATINETDGWIQNPNASSILAASTARAEAIHAFLRQQQRGITNGDVLERRTIHPFVANQLKASLPCRLISVGERWSDLPPAMTHKFRYTIYGSAFDRAMGEPMLTFEEELPHLAGRKVTLLYAPATKADADLVAAYMPKPHADGSPNTPRELAGVALPAYLIRLRPELRVDGVVRASGPVVPMGEELPATGAFTNLDLSSGWDMTDDLLLAGQATAIGLDVQGTDARLLEQVARSLKSTKDAIAGNSPAPLDAERLTGEPATAVILTYFAAVQAGARATSGAARILDLPALSYGLAHLDLEVGYEFGVPKTAKPSGVVMDVGHLRGIRWSRDDDRQKWNLYNRTEGALASAMEHAVPEWTFVGPDTPGEAISAVKLLAKAAAAGQKIFVITSMNATSALPQLNLQPTVMDDIRNAVAAGKEVTVHERSIAVGGWTGAGYVVLDPESGSGGYMISGGASGGKLLTETLGILAGLIAGLMFGGFLGWFAVGGLAFGWVALLAVIILATFIAIDVQLRSFMDEATYNCWYTGVTNGAEIGLAIGAAAGGRGGSAEHIRLLVSLVVGIVAAIGMNQLPTSPVWKCI